MKSIFNLRKAGLLAATVAVLFTACKKEASEKKPDVPAPGASTKLAKVSMDDEAMEFVYGGNGSLQAVKLNNDFITGGDLVTFNVSYTADKKISELKATGGPRIVAHYNNGELSTADMYDETNTLVFITRYEYLNGALKSATSSVGNIDALKFSFTYDAAGNVSKTNTWSFNPATTQLEPSGHTTYTYDAKENPMHTHKTLLYLLLQNISKNNTAKEMAYDAQNQLDETKEYTYQYNAKNLPQSATVKTTVPGQTATTSTLLFSYQ
jgi:hypothetical protein